MEEGEGELTVKPDYIHEDDFPYDPHQAHHSLGKEEEGMMEVLRRTPVSVAILGQLVVAAGLMGAAVMMVVGLEGIHPDVGRKDADED